MPDNTTGTRTPAVENRSIRIVIAESLGVLRGALGALLDREEDFAVAGEAMDGADLVKQVDRLVPDVILLEPGLPGPPIDSMLTEAMLLHPTLKVLLLASPQETPAAIALLEAGAAGCILKSDRPEELVRGIRAVAKGELAVSSAVALALLQHRRQGPSPVEALTEREQEVYDLLAAGLTNKEIAQRLYLSVRTIEVHLRNIFAKLGVRSRLEAVTRGSPRNPSGSPERLR